MNNVKKNSLSIWQGIPDGLLLLFETLLDNSSQIFENVPDGEKGEANKKTKGASDVGYQRDTVVGDHLLNTPNLDWCKTCTENMQNLDFYFI